MCLEILGLVLAAKGQSLAGIKNVSFHMEGKGKGIGE